MLGNCHRVFRQMALVLGELLGEQEGAGEVNETLAKVMGC